jgi:hypothetical protein
MTETCWIRNHINLNHGHLLLHLHVHGTTIIDLSISKFQLIGSIPMLCLWRLWQIAGVQETYVEVHLQNTAF